MYDFAYIIGLLFRIPHFQSAFLGPSSQISNSNWNFIECSKKHCQMSRDDFDNLERAHVDLAMVSARPTVFNDSIYGHVELSNISKHVIDTPQFQRLRDITQLGGVYYVFPAAASRRYEHSIGVAHLAQTLIRRLRKNQPEFERARDCAGRGLQTYQDERMLARHTRLLACY